MTITLDLGAVSQTIAILVAVGTVGFFLYSGMKKVRSWFRGREFDGDMRENMRRRWAEIERSMQAPGEMGRKIAIIEADKLLDTALKSLSMPGQTLGERLKFATYKYPAIREVWQAHRIRNQLAHEATFHLDAGSAKRAIRQFKSALELLGAL